MRPPLGASSPDKRPPPATSKSSRRSGVYQKDAYEGRQMRFGVREHGMSSVMNGMFAYGGIRPFGATFLN
ncbi:unnamed protein product, partial [Scytosiphon promiscuus]